MASDSVPTGMPERIRVWRSEFVQDGGHWTETGMEQYPEYVPASRLSEAVRLMEEVEKEFRGSCTHCAYWNFQSGGLMSRLHEFITKNKEER